MNAVVKTPHGEVRVHKAALEWMRDTLSKHRRRYGGRDRQELTARGSLPGSGYPDMDVHTSRFEQSSCALGPLGRRR
jgi:hypothetical protein